MPIRIFTGVDQNKVTKGAMILDAMVQVGICETNSEARRLIKQGGIKYNGKKVTNPKMTIALVDDDNIEWGVFKVGKRYIMVKRGE